MKRSRKYLEKRTRMGARTASVDVQTALEQIISVASKWESVDLAVRLGVNPRKADQNIRGTTVLPKGTGKTPRVLVLCKEDKAEEAKAAGADYAGLDEYIDKIADGWLEFDRVIATPDVMKNVSKVAKVLGPRGLMPNPKSGTVTNDVASGIAELKSGKIEYRVDKAGVVHLSVGRASFTLEDLKENVDHIVGVLAKAKPAAFKGQYMKSIHLSATQTPGVRVEVSAFSS